MTDPKITWDRDARALYVQYSEAQVARTITVSSTVFIDVDENGNEVGMEILGVDADIFAALDGHTHATTLRDLIHSAA